MYKNVYGCDRVRERKLSDILEEVYPDVLERYNWQIKIIRTTFQERGRGILKRSS